MGSDYLCFGPIDSIVCLIFWPSYFGLDPLMLTMHLGLLKEDMLHKF